MFDYLTIVVRNRQGDEAHFTPDERNLLSHAFKNLIPDRHFNRLNPEFAEVKDRLLAAWQNCSKKTTFEHNVWVLDQELRALKQPSGTLYLIRASRLRTQARHSCLFAVSSAEWVFETVPLGCTHEAQYNGEPVFAPVCRACKTLHVFGFLLRNFFSRG